LANNRTDAQIIKIERLDYEVLINSMMGNGFMSALDFLGTNRNTILCYYHQSYKSQNLNVKVIQQLKDDEERINQSRV